MTYVKELRCPNPNSGSEIQSVCYGLISGQFKLGLTIWG
jgi:hypothetical protein